MAQKTKLGTEEVADLLMESPITVCEWMQRGMLHAEVLKDELVRPFNLGDVAQFAREHGLQFNRPDRDRLRILIVNDNVQAANQLVELLDTLSETAEAMAVHNAFDAGRKIPYFQPDVVLVDLHMPYQDTVEICRQIKSDHTTRHVRLITVTNLVDQEHKQRMLMAGIDVCLERPLSNQQLLDVMGLCPDPAKEREGIYQDTVVSTKNEYYQTD